MLTPPEVMELIERDARRYLNMSRDEFFEAMRSGALPDTSSVAHLKILAGASRG